MASLIGSSRFAYLFLVCVGATRVVQVQGIRSENQDEVAGTSGHQRAFMAEAGTMLGGYILLERLSVNKANTSAAAWPGLLGGMRDRYGDNVVVLGRGGFGEVWKAKDQTTGKMVAVKVFIGSSEGGYGSTPTSYLSWDSADEGQRKLLQEASQECDLQLHLYEGAHLDPLGAAHIAGCLENQVKGKGDIPSYLVMSLGGPEMTHWFEVHGGRGGSALAAKPKTACPVNYPKCLRECHYIKEPTEPLGIETYVVDFSKCRSGHCAIVDCEGRGCRKNRAPSADTDPAGTYTYIKGYDGSGEYCDGDHASLHRVVEGTGKHHVHDEMRSFIAQIMQALRFLQSFDPPIVHHDLKPANVIYTQDADGTLHIQLIDFGASMQGTRFNSIKHDFVASDKWAPRETKPGCAFEKPWHSYDVFSVGLMYINVLCPAISMTKVVEAIKEAPYEDMLSVVSGILQSSYQGKLICAPTSSEEVALIASMLGPAVDRPSPAEALASPVLRDHQSTDRFEGLPSSSSGKAN